MSVAATVLTLLVSIPGAYAVSRLRFVGRRQVHFLFLAVYLFPAILLAIPLFVLFTRLGLRGSLVGLTIVYIAQTVPVSIYMLRNYLSTIPVSLEEAAAVDGYTRLQTIRKVILPLAAPAVMATALYVFMIAWNEFLFALLFLVEDRADWTVSLGLAQLSGGIEVQQDGADGRVGGAYPAHRDHLLRGRAAADRGADRRCGQGVGRRATRARRVTCCGWSAPGGPARAASCRRTPACRGRRSRSGSTCSAPPATCAPPAWRSRPAAGRPSCWSSTPATA